MVKTYQVVLLPQAVKSLREITDYLRRKESDQVATYVRKNILVNIKKLSNMPHKHEVLHEISQGKITYRRSLQWSYRIIFTIFEEELRVEVVDVDHTATDLAALKERFNP
jgi:plasmid stabilization system protein ParE